MRLLNCFYFPRCDVFLSFLKFSTNLIKKITKFELKKNLTNFTKFEITKPVMGFWQSTLNIFLLPFVCAGNIHKFISNVFRFATYALAKLDVVFISNIAGRSILLQWFHSKNQFLNLLVGFLFYLQFVILRLFSMFFLFLVYLS